MFEESETAARSLVDRIRAAGRDEARAAAQMLVSIGHLFRLRLRESGECASWAADTMEEVCGEVAAALRISQGLAGYHLWHARAMRERLPKSAELFIAGDIDYFLFAVLVSRAMLITDADILAAVDAELAAAVTRWPSLSRGQLAGRVDRIIARHARDAVRRRKKNSANRHIDIWNSGDGYSEIRGFLRNLDGHALDERLDALAATVCQNDPRSRAQRRADAIAALVAGADRLACECEGPDCTAGAKPPASPVVIHVIAEQATLDGTGHTPGSTLDPDALVPPEQITELATSARLVPLVHPGAAPAQRGYTPSPALADFVRCRDLSCRFPGCDRPALDCDLDHTIPYRVGGPTQASNLKCMCRIHHLLKTFWRWRDQQLPDGTVIWTSPSGQTYTTTPGSALWFPTLCRPTAAPAPITRTGTGSTDPTAMMPTRRATRADNQARRIAEERRQNRQHRDVEAAKQRWQQALAMANDEPPPF